MQHKVRFLIACAIVAVAIALSGSVLWLRTSNNNHAYAYSCYYNKSWNYARCVDRGSAGGCYGYYYLIGKSPEAGIKVTGVIGSTCEGIVGGNSETTRIYFDHDGKFIK